MNSSGKTGLWRSLVTKFTSSQGCDFQSGVCMKIKILLVVLCVVYSSFTVAKAQSQKLLLETLSAKLSANQTTAHTDLMQPIASVKPHYNPYTGATLFIHFSAIEVNENIDKRRLSQANQQKQQNFKESQQQARALSHHIYQLERKLSALKKSHNNQAQIEAIQQQLSELTIKKAKANNQYQQNKHAIFDDVIATNTLTQLQKQISGNVCHLSNNDKQSLKSITFVLAGIQNTTQEITWHFADLNRCRDNSLNQQTLFTESRLSSQF